jgi:tetratricopeptide (TPR) repeat protein
MLAVIFNVHFGRLVPDAGQRVGSCQWTARQKTVHSQRAGHATTLARICRSVSLIGAVCLAFSLAEHAWGGIVFSSGGSGQSTQVDELTPSRLGADVADQDGLAELSDAIDQFQQGQLQTSLQRLQDAFERNDNLPPPPVMLARMLIVASQTTAARDFLERAAVDFPDSAHVHLAFAQLAIREARITDAQLHLEKSRQLHAAETNRQASVGMEILNGFVWVAQQREQWAEAEQFLTRILKVKPDDHHSRHRLGIALFQQEKIDQAEQALRTAAGADETLEPAPLTLAWLHHRREQDREAVRWMEVALEEAAEDPRVLRAATLLYYERDEVETAGAHSAHWLRLQPESGEAILLSATLARSAGELEQARQLLERRLLEEPDDFEAAYQLVLVLAASDDVAERQRGVRRADLLRRQFSEHPLSHTALAWAFFRASDELSAEQKSEILGLFDQAVGAGAATPEVIFQYVQLQHALGDSDRGDALLEELLSLRKPFPGRTAAMALSRQWKIVQGEPDQETGRTAESIGNGGTD